MINRCCECDRRFAYIKATGTYKYGYRDTSYYMLCIWCYKNARSIFNYKDYEWTFEDTIRIEPIELLL